MRFVLIGACALLAAGCAIRPLPEQVAGVTTFHIVKQVRCETREAVFNNFVKTLADNPEVFGEKARATAESFRGHPELMDRFRPALFSGDARDFVNYFWNAGIAYNFSLDMTEVNNLDANIDFIQPLARSTRTVALGGGLDRQRENIRTFTITDDFKGLLNIQPKSYCDGYVVEAENHVYPIVGKIGIEPFIHQFVRIALFTNLKEDKDGSAPTMVDTLKFQTVFSGSATPKVVFSPIGRGFQVADASLTALAKRTDVHTLTMGLSVLDGPVDQSPAGSKQLIGRLLTSTGRGTKKTAANAVDQELTRQALSKTVIVNQ